MKKIVLVGYMGSGKTTVGKILSQKTGIPSDDLDAVIEHKQQMTIRELFEKKGEIYFRKLEHQALSALLNEPREIILSLGGGTPCYANNYEFLNRNDVVSFYLKASPVKLLERLNNESDSRPLIASVAESERADYVAAHLFERSFYYNQAQFKIDTDSKSPEEVAGEILKILA
ncbi:MAG: shikimate kinase [Flavobacterium sp. BFFFF1]|uniref:shikimate kinase n=1 Tax=unclassified Flavobacterium TaxID=196869 RepID=UPI000BCA2876|nr:MULTISPECIES: shikimate kinase [unclassified Flavobacterium]OYU80555.1 MAG: shikimate kinase [Flavobacterium sp. BFFFF1]